MIRTTDLFLFTIYIIYLIGYLVDGASKNAPNVCPVEEEVEELSLKKHEQTVVLHTTKACWDVTQGFRCKVKNNGTKLSYKAVPTKRKIIVYRCCHGYFETPEETCEMCPEGHYGNNCASRCNCSENEMCHNVIGCCDPAHKQCSTVIESDELQAYIGNSSWIFPVLLASLLALALFIFGTIFYRKKYMKEKDPDLPTLTYRPDVKEFLPPNELESREFNNPLYRQSAIDCIPRKITPNDVNERIINLRRVPTMNEYATMDYASAALSEPSSTEPLLSSPSPYEVPMQHSMTPSPVARKFENKANERIESV